MTPPISTIQPDGSHTMWKTFCDWVKITLLIYKMRLAEGTFMTIHKQIEENVWN